MEQINDFIDIISCRETDEDCSFVIDPPIKNASRLIGVFDEKLFCGLECSETIRVNDQFSEIKMRSRKINGINYLTLETSLEFRNLLFSLANVLFSDTELRIYQEQPRIFYDYIKEAIGNSKKNISAYSTIAELLTVNYLRKQQYESINWTGPFAYLSPHDIETKNHSFEIKSSLSRNNKEVNISSIDQLSRNGSPPKDLFLLHFELEKDDDGKYSINTVLDALSLNEAEKTEFEKKLNRLSLYEGRFSRNDLYSIRTIKKYAVNETFPKLTRGDISNTAITSVKYTISLTASDLEVEVMDESLFF